MNNSNSSESATFNPNVHESVYFKPRELEQIDNDLTAIIPRLGKLCCTPRVAEETGMNRLLDERNQRVQIIEDYEGVFCDEF